MKNIEGILNVNDNEIFWKRLGMRRWTMEIIKPMLDQDIHFDSVNQA